VLDLFAARLPLPEGETGGGVNKIPGAMQLTAANSRDICFSFRSQFLKKHSAAPLRRMLTAGAVQIYQGRQENPLPARDVARIGAVPPLLT